MKTETMITGFGATLIAIILIMIIAAFSIHGGDGIFNMGAHHDLLTTGTINSTDL